MMTHVLVCTGLGLLAWSLLSGAAAAADLCERPQAVAKIVSVQGTVTVNQIHASLDSLVCPGDVIQTGRFSRAAVALFETETVLRIDQQTQLRLRAPPGKRRSWLDLMHGIIYLFSREPRALDVNTPFLNAAVEGTEFLVQATDTRAVVTVFEGQVLASNEQGRLTIGSHQQGAATAGQAPRLSAVVRPRDTVQWALYYQPVLAAPVQPGTSVTFSYQTPSDSTVALQRLEQIPPARRDESFYVFRAGLLLTVGRVGEARLNLDRALELNPNSAQAPALLAIIAVTQNDRNTALQLAQDAVARDPDSAAARLALSYARQARFELDGALDSVRAAAERNPENALIWARLAELRLAMGDLDGALDNAQQAVALSPELARTQTVLGFAYLTRIDIRQAKEAFARAIELDQADPLPRLGFGLARIRDGELKDGRRDIEIAASLDPNNSLFRSYLGKAYYEEKRDALAGSQYEISKTLDPFDPTPWFYDAILKQTSNQPVKALRDLQTSIALNDDRAVYRSRLLLDQDLAARGLGSSIGIWVSSSWPW